MTRDEVVEMLWTESDEQFPGRITREGCEWVVDLFIEHGLLPTEEEWSTDRLGAMGVRYVTDNEMLAEVMASAIPGTKVLHRFAPPWKGAK